MWTLSTKMSAVEVRKEEAELGCGWNLYHGRSFLRGISILGGVEVEVGLPKTVGSLWNEQLVSPKSLDRLDGA